MNAATDNNEIAATPAFQTRDYRPDDAPALAVVYRAAILTTAAAAYSAEQCRGWAASADDAPGWARRLQDAWVRVACNKDGEIVGFGGILFPGHIDLLFTLPAYNRQGVASLILTDLFDLAAAMGAKQVSTDASELSRPLFERQGFRLLESASHCRGGQSLTCHRLVKSLTEK